MKVIPQLKGYSLGDIPGVTAVANSSPVSDGQSNPVASSRWFDLWAIPRTKCAHNDPATKIIFT